MRTALAASSKLGDDKMKPTIYMDNCCYNRPFDDQQHIVIKLETEAKLQIQHDVLLGKYVLIWSFILFYENDKNPFADRKSQIRLWENAAEHIVTSENTVRDKAREIMGLGIRAKDALHLACALIAGTDYFITTDKKLLNKAIDSITIINPIDFVRRPQDESR